MVKTFVISANQIAVLRALAVQNGVPQEEIDALKGSDLALRFKMVNGLIPAAKSKIEDFKVKFASFIGFNLAEHKNAPVVEVAPIEGATEMPSPEKTRKGKKTEKTAEIAA